MGSLGGGASESDSFLAAWIDLSPIGAVHFFRKPHIQFLELRGGCLPCLTFERFEVGVSTCKFWRHHRGPSSSRPDHRRPEAMVSSHSNVHVHIKSVIFPNILHTIDIEVAT